MPPIIESLFTASAQVHDLVAQFMDLLPAMIATPTSARNPSACLPAMLDMVQCSPPAAFRITAPKAPTASCAVYEAERSHGSPEVDTPEITMRVYLQGGHGLTPAVIANLVVGMKDLL